ncbi:ABC transporter ATP-binding protein [bacterium]|nr:ABC transporter ATP-binding protein [bacterium]
MWAVEVKDLTIRFGDFIAVDRISFAVKAGEIFGFLGANGAGKTTTIRTLCGLLAPTSGNARVAGLDFKSGVQAIKSKVGYMSQRFTLYNDLTVSENMAFTASLRKLKPDMLQLRSRELFKFVDFDYPVKTLVKDLPGGIKQQLSLAASLLHDPEIVFLDEPTAGVSPLVRNKFWSLIRKLAGAGKTMFVTTHYLQEAEQCNRIALMREGRIIALDTPPRLKAASFPEPLIEINPELGSSRQWVENLKLDSRVGSIQPYGRRYHVLVQNQTAWKKIARTMPKSLKTRIIQPSLEDVFIRLVESGRT